MDVHKLTGGGILLSKRFIFQIFLLVPAFFIITGFLETAYGRAREVVVYTALDQVYSEPVLNRFQTETGIKVRALYDIEATKTIGLVNRIIAEKSRPRCDVFWNNEIVNTLRLKQRGLIAPYLSSQASDFPEVLRDPDRYWCGFAARARVIVYNTALLKGKPKPLSITALIQEKWKNQACMALPLFGTTATHATALFHFWGKDKTLRFFRDLRKNGVDLVDGNSVVRDKVARGTYLWGFTDTDDVYSGMKRGMPIDMLLPDQDGMGTLVIPNTVGLIQNAPHPGAGKALIDFLLSEATERMLAHSGSGQIPLRSGLKPVSGMPAVEQIRPMKVDYDRLAVLMEDVLPLLEEELQKTP